MKVRKVRIRRTYRAVSMSWRTLRAAIIARSKKRVKNTINCMNRQIVNFPAMRDHRRQEQNIHAMTRSGRTMLSEEQVKHYEEKGYLVFDNLFAPEEIDPIR